ncbi:MAG: ribonuclease E/G [Deltaproteobacteria bacterium]|nr:MAG: ribonuclease E/G [Deltaproteobacteria bacterium]
MPKQMLFNMTEPEEIRATIVEDGKVVEFDIETQTREKNRNNIYRGYIVQIEPSIQAAFVEYGANRHGFLPFGEIHPSFFNQDSANKEDSNNVAQMIRKGQTVLVQVVREEIGNKGAALTTYCTLPGRYLVFMPMSNKTGISRKIENQSERRALREVIEGISTPNNEGFIVRTAGSGMTREDLSRDLEILSRLWGNIQNAARRGPRAGLIFEDGDLLQRMIRDYYNDDVEAIYIDEEDAYERASTYFDAVMPHQDNVVKHYNDDMPLFIAHNIEEQLSQLYQRKIPLPSGGSIVFDSTEALVAIDVNSGKTQSDNTEETAYKTNLEAAEEIVRQLRLRDLGGLVVIDFIGMRQGKHNRGVERAVRQAIKGDKARVKVGRISSYFGLLTLSRQRIRDAKGFAFFTECSSCSGTGKVPNAESAAVGVLRQFQLLAAGEQYEKITASLPHDVAMYLLNHKRTRIAELEEKHDCLIMIKPRDNAAINLEQDLVLHPRQSAPKRRRQPQRKPVSSLAAAQSVPTRPAPAPEAEAPVSEPERTEHTVQRVESSEDNHLDSRSDRRSDSRSDHRSDSRPDHRSDSRSDHRSDSRSDRRSDDRSDRRSDSRSERRDRDSHRGERSRSRSSRSNRTSPSVDVALPWFMEHLPTNQEAKTKDEVLAWASDQPNQPPVTVAKPKLQSRANGTTRVRANAKAAPAQAEVKQASQEEEAPLNGHSSRRPRRGRTRPVPGRPGPNRSDSAAPVSARSPRRRPRRGSSSSEADVAAVEPKATESTPKAQNTPKATESTPKATESTPKPQAAAKSSSSSSSRARGSRWTEEELSVIASLRHLPLVEAHRQFQAQGYKRTPSAFRQKYYSVSS